MKRILLALVIASATMLSFNSCTKEYITNNEFLPGVSFYEDLLGGSAWRPVSVQLTCLSKPYLFQN
ncbi:hypothetical protein [Sphingobacterium populi]|uniref:hypothetical protein n=1 Tax=Sphingobacterium sp. CFCC 11742 TaxID=1775560 RepID=UPI0012E891A1|nr:hypothetical protein [Sphingobacterium sp. CFCC 11742]